MNLVHASRKEMVKDAPWASYMHGCRNPMVEKRNTPNMTHGMPAIIDCGQHAGGNFWICLMAVLLLLSVNAKSGWLKMQSL